MNKSLVLGVLLGAGIHAPAQTLSPNANPDLPKAPFVARAPEFSAWTIDVNPKAAAKASATATPIPVAGSPARETSSPPKKVMVKSVVTKTRDILRDVRTYSDGTKTESWWIHGYILRQHPEGAYINVIDPGRDQSAPQFGSGDFEGMAWIDLDHFVKSEKKSGVQCYLYEWKERLPTGADFEKISNYGDKIALYLRFKGKPQSETRAWIARESKFPVSAEDETATYVYKSLEAPVDMLTLPPEFQKVWDRYKADLDDWKPHVMPKQK